MLKCKKTAVSWVIQRRKSPLNGHSTESGESNSLAIQWDDSSNKSIKAALCIMVWGSTPLTLGIICNILLNIWK